jgi:hypothetical protein
VLYNVGAAMRFAVAWCAVWWGMPCIITSGDGSECSRVGAAGMQPASPLCFVGVCAVEPASVGVHCSCC